jgi:hypothetical protein
MISGGPLRFASLFDLRFRNNRGKQTHRNRKSQNEGPEESRRFKNAAGIVLGSATHAAIVPQEHQFRSFGPPPHALFGENKIQARSQWRSSASKNPMA